MNLIGIFVLIMLCLVVFFTPRRFALLGVMGSVCYMTQSQSINVFGFSFWAFRIVLLVGIARILRRKELQNILWNRIDYLIVSYAVFTNVVISVRLGAWQEQAGSIYNILLSYFVFRSLITDWEQALEFFKDLTVFIIPLAAFMMLEALTHKNLFVLMGGEDLGWMRGDRLRCVGSFRGPHSAGVFGATLMPIFVALLFLSPTHRLTATFGIVAATSITITSNSSGPLMAYLSGLVGLAFWKFRSKMRAVRWGIVASLILLAITMEAPIWYIFAKISDITGGDGWHRSYLMEQCFNHFFDWWLMGTSNTGSWAATQMAWGGADLCNLYVSCAASAGLGCLTLMIMLLVQCFRSLGHALQVTRSKAPAVELLLWCFGCTLFAHVVTVFSVTYFDQIQVVWWGLFAIISSITTNLSVANVDSCQEEIIEPTEPTEEEAFV